MENIDWSFVGYVLTPVGTLVQMLHKSRIKESDSRSGSEAGRLSSRNLARRVAWVNWFSNCSWCYTPLLGPYILFFDLCVTNERGVMRLRGGGEVHLKLGEAKRTSLSVCARSPASATCLEPLVGLFLVLLVLNALDVKLVSRFSHIMSIFRSPSTFLIVGV